MEVYKARDTRLERTVAVKILSPALSGNPESRQRFEREARAVSSLNHPHICTLHDIGRQDETDYIVMELIEGETLADRLESRTPVRPRPSPNLPDRPDPRIVTYLSVLRDDGDIPRESRRYDDPVRFDPSHIALVIEGNQEFPGQATQPPDS
ncbi:MAG: hypothetical protein FJW35_06110 [Acidobacteria bacterium]|nr:hypothetical protein [Acidobacteriota bacterium]